MTGFDRTPRRALNVRARAIRGQLHVASGGDVYELTEVASRIWQLSDGSRSISAIAQVLVEEYDVDTEQAETDIEAFVDDLAAAELMVWVES